MQGTVLRLTPQELIEKAIELTIQSSELENTIKMDSDAFIKLVEFINSEYYDVEKSRNIGEYKFCSTLTRIYIREGGFYYREANYCNITVDGGSLTGAFIACSVNSKHKNNKKGLFVFELKC